MTYDLKPMDAPVANGWRLKALVWLIENPITGALLSKTLLKNAGILSLREVPCERDPLYRPELLKLKPSALALTVESGEHEDVVDAFETSTVLHRKYGDGTLSAVSLADRVTDMFRERESCTPRDCVLVHHNPDDLKAQATDSDSRRASGQIRGLLEGIPIAVKDEMDVQGYPTGVGTRFMAGAPAAADSEVVARLRSAGALIVGKANMHELGCGVSGINPHHGTARNPYGVDRFPGGSSSGSAAAVASGMCPMAIGLDGGGSIRIPAAFCGVVGLKPTFGRCSLHGASPLAWTVGHVGPIAASVSDAARMYQVMAGEDPKDLTTLGQPKMSMSESYNSDLSGIRVGVYDAWFNDAQPDVVERCREMLAVLEKKGAEIVPIEVEGLSLLRSVHLISITGEMTGSAMKYYEAHRHLLSLETRINFALALRFSAADYVHAARHRRRISEEFNSLLETVDVIASPTTGRTAPSASELAFATGESNVRLTGDIMRYAPAANATGLPAISVPAGYDREGLPIGFQMMGRAWEEALLLRLGLACEDAVEHKRPSGWKSLLG